MRFIQHSRLQRQIGGANVVLPRYTIKIKPLLKIQQIRGDTGQQLIHLWPLRIKRMCVCIYIYIYICVCVCVCVCVNFRIKLIYRPTYAIYKNNINPQPVQTVPRAHPATCTTGNGPFPRVKRGRGVTLTPHPF